MCGIAGILDWGLPAPLVLPQLTAMLARQAHRGPDGQGILQSPPIHLGHNRLAIVDPTGGHQPHISQDGRLLLVFNGQLYNHRALAAALPGAPTFATDTALLAELWSHRGPACLPDLDGMFALAIWDRPRRELLLCRDPLGVKPLVYTRPDPAAPFRFASEAHAATPTPKLDPQGLAEWAVMPAFSGAGRLPLAGLQVLPKGHLLRVTRHAHTLHRWHRPSPSAPPADLAQTHLAQTHLAQTLRRAFTQAVHDRVPARVGASLFLSGGLDSSAIATAAAQVAPRLPALTITFDHQPTFDYRHGIVRANDTPFARLAAAHAGLPHHLVAAPTATLPARLREIAIANDRLPAWEQELSQHALSRAAAQHGKVVLVGDAADETHWGYDFLLALATPDAPARLLQRFGRPALHPDGPDTAATLIARYRQRFQAHGLQHPDDRLAAMAALVTDTWLCRLLHNGDLHTMTFGLEARVPFAAPAVLACARQVPPSLGFQHGCEKSLLRHALGPLVPATIRDRRKSALPFDQGAEPVYRAESLRLLDRIATHLNPNTVRALATAPRPLTGIERATLFQAIVFAHWATHHGL